jgi:hypothetical protein
MSHRSIQVLFQLLAATLVLTYVASGCGSEQTADETVEAVDSTAGDTVRAVEAEPEVSQASWVMSQPPDSPAELQRKIRRIHDWYPMHREKLDWMLKGITKVSYFSDLGLGDQTEIALPAEGKAGWPIGHSVQLELAGEKTALVIRFQVDTLPGPRVAGEGVLGVVALHCSETFGRDVVLEREQSGTGRFDLQVLRDDLVTADLACCDIPPTFLLRNYGDAGDTLAVMLVFEKKRQKYSIHVIGPGMTKTFPGMGYKLFRTERGEFHKDETDYPYMCRDLDPDYVRLFIGSRWRGRRSVREPILKATLF